jgi:hypothetical protein
MIAQSKEKKVCFSPCSQEIIEQGRCSCINRIADETLRRTAKTEEELTRNINSI